MVGVTGKLKGKVLILGIGNPMKQDDGLGPQLIEKLKSQKPKAELLNAGTAPENYTGKIKQINPDTLVIIDAIEFGEKPGSIKVFEIEQIKTRSLSTHNISLKTFVDFLKADLPKLNVVVVGIQPKAINFKEGLSPEIEKAVAELCTSFI